MTDNRGSITQDSNPEGINQYSGAASRAEKASERAKDSSERANYSGKASMHEHAANAHYAAANAHDKAALKSEPGSKQWWQHVTARDKHHEVAQSHNREMQKAQRKENLAAHKDAWERREGVGKYSKKG